MGEPFSGARWKDAALSPVEVSSPATYSRDATGKLRRAELRDSDGALLGHVWTDGKEAAGFTPADEAGAAGVRAGGRVWRILADAYDADVPAAGVLDPSLYGPDFTLEP